MSIVEPGNFFRSSSVATLQICSKSCKNSPASNTLVLVMSASSAMVLSTRAFVIKHLICYGLRRLFSSKRSRHSGVDPWGVSEPAHDQTASTMSAALTLSGAGVRASCRGSNHS